MRMIRFFSMTILFVILLGVTLAAFAKDPAVGKTYYTKINMWYDGTTIPATNYHKGARLTIGSKVIITKVDSWGISFEFGREQVEFRLDNTSFVKASVKELFDRYFSESNPLEGEEFLRFSDDEKNNIKKGKIVIGMSKEAVLMAYGYPPKNKTPTLDADMWLYCKSKMINLCVAFENNKVVNPDYRE